MLQCERIDISEGNDTNKTSASKGFMLCHYWYLKDIGYKFQSNICNKCIKKHRKTECKRC